jgi:hypothetical protein
MDMKRTTAVGSVIAAIGVGALLATGVTGLANAGPENMRNSERPYAKEGQMGKHGSTKGARGHNAVRGEHVVQDADGGFTTYRMTSGVVSAISPTSITVTAADGTSQTYAISASTMIGKDRSPATISDITTDATVRVMGTVSGATASAEKIHIRTK